MLWPFTGSTTYSFNKKITNEATITIESKTPKVVKESVCTNELGKAVVDLGSYNLDIELQEIQWLFAGYSTDADTEQYSGASFSVNTPFVTEALARPSAAAPAPKAALTATEASVEVA